jgi:hypothetical protein
VSAIVVGGFIYKSQWTIFRMPDTVGLVLADRPVAIMGPIQNSAVPFDHRQFFTMPLSPANLLFGVQDSPLPEMIATGKLSYNFLGTLWAQAFGASDFNLTDPAVFQSHLAYNFARQEIYAKNDEDLLALRRLVGRRTPPRVFSRRPRRP